MVENNEVSLLGVKISNLTSTELNKRILAVVQGGFKKQMILNVNINAINIAYNNVWFKDLLNNAHINFCDGDGVRLGAAILGKSIREKITYNRWIWELGDFSSKHGLNWYIIGSKEHVIKKAKCVLLKRIPGLEIVGSHHGYLTSPETNRILIEDINKKEPNILIVGMGMPLQEKWIMDNYDQLTFNVALTGGAVFEYVSGMTKMTPDIFYKLKLEWFYRFVHDPRRLFKRYFIGNPVFFLRIFMEIIKPSNKIK